jgi:adenosylhomocysteinase
MRSESGQQKIEWVKRRMGLLKVINERFRSEKPFLGVRIGMSIHLEAKTAYLAQVFRDGGASVAISGCNPLSVQDDVVAALAEEENIKVFAQRGVTSQEYEHHLSCVLDTNPQIIIDDGGDLVRLLHTTKAEVDVWGGCEETTTGVHRLRVLEREGKLRFAMFAVNDAKMKFLFDNRYGTGQSTWEGIMRATNLSVAGKTVVIAGYGWCGRGIAMRAKGLGANVIITEVDPVRAVEAVMEGFRVMPISEAAKLGDIFITTTGCKDIITQAEMEQMKDGAILANSGHFDVEIKKPDLERLAVKKEKIKPNIEEFTLKDGRRLYLLAEGRLVNLVAADGHPVEIMDISFALQALTAEYLLKHKDGLKPRLYPVPKEIDEQVARMKLEDLEVRIDRLSKGQQEYLAKWS